ncbi:MAG: hypothetical protein DRQ55_04150 [Planctomycetota bacterium]|nr:MAG: hypothetical protein DRQ55_04150 [Planctomycetota bacterium]
MTRSPRRSHLPLLLAMLGLVGSIMGWPAAGALVLFCPGWGLTRLVSVIDRAFAVAGSALCLSWVVLGGGMLAGAALGWSAVRTGFVIQLVSVLLCLAGRLRLARHDRWQASQPPHPAPMPLWPARTGACLLVLLATLLSVNYVAPVDHMDPQAGALTSASRAVAWLEGGYAPLDATHSLDGDDLPAAAVAGLVAATDIAPSHAVRLICLGALAACLLLVSEAVARLLGNHGGTRAMLALLLLLNPLAVVFMLSGDPATPVLSRMAPRMAPGITTALSPFVQGVQLPMTLAFTALLLATSLSVLRRSSRHVPRLMLLAAAGLVIADVRAAILLLPGWCLGLAMSHLACLDSPDNDPHGGSRVRRPGEPVVLRAPFWRPALHLALGAGLGLLVTGLPELPVWLRREPAWALLAAVGPGCLLYMPGVRHLNASPGREAFFFVGLALVSGLLTVCLPFDGDQGELAARLAALVLAAPAAHGALKLSEGAGPGRRVVLGMATGLVALGPAIWLIEQAGTRARVVDTHADGSLSAPHLDRDLVKLLGSLDRVARSDAYLILDQDELLPSPTLAALIGRRPLLPTQGDLAEVGRQVLKGQTLALAELLGTPGLSGRDAWVLSRRKLSSILPVIYRRGAWSLHRARAPDVLLITISSLRADRLTPEHMPQLSLRARSGVLFQNAVTPSPAPGAGLASLLTGLSPIEHGVRGASGSLNPGAPHLASRYAARGYRTVALVALERGQGLLSAFEEVFVDPDARASSLIPKAIASISAPDARPVFMWLHLADLEPPYVLPPELQDERTGHFPFPDDPESIPFGLAAFPPTPSPVGGGRELDLARGRACYDALVTDLDRLLEPLVASLPALDMLVLTAPHGTSLDEHQTWFAAGPDLFEPSIRVPLMVCGGGAAASTPDKLVSLSDLGDVLLRGVPADRERVLLESGWRPGLGTGASLPPELDPGARGAALRIWGVRTAHAKTILTSPAKGEQASAGMSYELADDPGEMAPRAADAYDLRLIDAWRRGAHEPTAGDG